MSADIIRKSADEGKLVVIFGAGASIALTQKSKKALSWIDLVRSGLDHARARGFVKDIQHNRYVDALQSDDIDELLGAAEFIGRKLDAPSGDQYADRPPRGGPSSKLVQCRR
ncbi:hypothetical protein, partial [Methylobacterium frigidaeris]|uniref:hypothetical protein n=1 Tax=Methylobacterium frigidaeris TaxID=2038277 RepID=UPI001EE0ECDF